ncbi:hypothetical protein C7H19_14205 [Aphanothece hegewaldii CCALA 016]|uniref:Uncharacterized protein n=1 Tax=Aphanothece hegewaldii CCALA 016 TaxID=2107694 RepID=A0A2T1LW84_9CHRO|nr:hypothetical protein [Aphanothece hegewaldii]PSF36147.1 hypothetical protein C7H19_14205 [Aphanothece hegewaldii CCALA 016]
MSSTFSFFKQILRRGIFVVVLVSLINLAGWFLPTIQPSYAGVSSPAEELKDIRKDLAAQDPEKIYEEATDPSVDPKMGVEKKFEENLKEYNKENPDQGGLLGGAKELINKITEEK